MLRAKEIMFSGDWKKSLSGLAKCKPKYFDLMKTDQL